jgi:acyl-CoA thioester hydrolase
MAAFEAGAMAARAEYWFFWPHKVPYREIDAQGVAFNGHYLGWFDTALTEYLRALPYRYPLGGDKESGTDFHVVRAVVEYKAPIRFDDEIEVAVRTLKFGRTSVTFDLAIFPRGGDALLSAGEIVWVNAFVGAHKSAPLPEKLIAAVRAREPNVA